MPCYLSANLFDSPQRTLQLSKVFLKYSLVDQCRQRKQTPISWSEDFKLLEIIGKLWGLRSSLKVHIGRSITRRGKYGVNFILPMRSLIFTIFTMIFPWSSTPRRHLWLITRESWLRGQKHEAGKGNQVLNYTTEKMFSPWTSSTQGWSGSRMRKKLIVLMSSFIDEQTFISMSLSGDSKSQTLAIKVQASSLDWTFSGIRITYQPQSMAEKESRDCDSSSREVF